MDASDHERPSSAPEHGATEDHSNDDTGGCGEDHLQDAKAHLERSLGIDSAESGPRADLASQCEREIACLEEWARAHALWLDLGDFTQLATGGQEHDYLLIGEPAIRDFRRVTKDGFGFYPQAVPVLHIGPGTPHQYFTRLLLMGALFPKLRYRFDGLVQLNGNTVLVTTQKYIPGKLLTEEATEDNPKRPLRIIEHWITKRGYQKLHLEQAIGPSMAWYNREQNIAVFDAKPANFLLCEDALFPVDIIPVQPTGLLLKKVLAAL